MTDNLTICYQDGDVREWFDVTNLQVDGEAGYLTFITRESGSRIDYMVPLEGVKVMYVEETEGDDDE